MTTGHADAGAVLAGGIRVRPLTAVIGAEIDGVDLGADLQPEVVECIRTALVRHGVVFFRDQDITPADQLRFAQAFGTVVLPFIDTASTEAPGVTVIDQCAPKLHPTFTDRWHTDHSFLESPPMGTILRAVELPPVGGDTCFASMTAAFDDLAPPMQRFLEGLSAVHSTDLVDAVVQPGSSVFKRDDRRAALHPVIRVHPESGRKAIFVTGNFTTRIVELGETESQAILSFLFAHSNSPRFHCRFRWEKHSVAFWDNRAVQHLAVPDYDQRRVMHRTMVAGDRPFGVTGGGPVGEPADPLTATESPSAHDRGGR